MTQSNSHIPPTSDNPPPKLRKPRRPLRFLLKLFCLLILLVILLALLAPTLLSTSPGNRFLLSQVNSRIPGKASASHISLAWFSGQQVDDLALADPQNQPVLQAKSVHTDVTLLALIRGNYHLGTTQITDLTATLTQNPDGTTNLSQSLAAPAAPNAQRPTSNESSVSHSAFNLPHLKLLLTNANLHFTAPQMDPVTISGLNLTADLLNPDHLQLTAQSQFAQANAAGHLDANVTAEHLLTSSGTFTPAAATYNATAILSALPVTALDRFLSLNGLADALGPTADAQIQATGKLEALTASLQLTTQHLLTKATINRTGPLDTAHLTATGLLHAAQSNLDANVQIKDLPLAAADKLLTAMHKAPLPIALVATAGPTLNATLTATGNQDHLTSKLTAQAASLSATLGADYTQNRISVTPNSTVHFNITPDLWAALVSSHFASSLTAPTTGQINLSRLDLPLTATAVDYSKSAVNVTFTAGPLGLTTPDMGPLKLNGTTLQLTSNSLTTAITAKAHTTIDQNNPTPTIDLTATASHLITATGAVDSANAPMQIDANLQNLPTPLVEKFLRKPGQFTPILGNVASATLSGRLASTGTNPLALTLNSQNAKASLSALIQNGLENGSVRLDKDATASLVVTPELSKAFLEKLTGWVNPSSGNNPITLTIKHEDFAATMPDLKNADLTKINATANVALGTLNLQANDPIVGAAISGLDLLIAAGESSSKPDWVNLAQGATALIPGKSKETPAESVTFSPTTITLKNGVAKYDNLTMTLRQLPFVFQGDVNLATKATNLTMTIPGTAIAQRFPGIAKSFGPGKDIVIPIGGTYDKPTPKLDALITQIAKFIPAGGSNGKPGIGDVIQGLQGLAGNKPAEGGQATTQKSAEQAIQGLLKGLEKKKPASTTTQPAR